MTQPSLPKTDSDFQTDAVEATALGNLWEENMKITKLATERSNPGKVRNRELAKRPFSGASFA